MQAFDISIFLDASGTYGTATRTIWPV